MINLLPPHKQKELFFLHTKKIVMVFGIAAIVSLICFWLILMSIKFYILSESVQTKSALELIHPTTVKNIEDIIDKYNSIMPGIVDFYSQKNYFNDTLKEIVNVEAPTGLEFLSIYLSRQGSGSIAATVSGTSDTRDHLINFRDSLNADKNIKNIQFSPDSWIKEKNAPFSFSFEFSK